MNRKCILIVDDESANIQSLAQALGGAGPEAPYSLRFAKTGEQALLLAHSAQPDLILLDVVLPGMNGLATLAKLQSDPITHGIPVIFVTARDEIDEEASGLEMGAVDYITKPFSPAIVRARVRTHLELKRQREFEAQRARIDGLTGIANRRAFDEQIQRYWAITASELAPGHLQLLLIDVDYFKRYNDRAGHGAGDECLRQLARSLQQTFERQHELVARLGGEEFAVLIQGGNLVQHAQRALDAVAAMALAHPDSPLGERVSISLGALERSVEADPMALLQAADVLLYQAKQQGRNRCCARNANGEIRQVFASNSGLGESA